MVKLGGKKSCRRRIRNGKIGVMTFIDDPFLTQKEAKFYQKNFFLKWRLI